MIKKKTSASNKSLSEMVHGGSNNGTTPSNQSSSSSSSSTSVQSGTKHKYHFKFIVSALEILPEKPTSNSNTTTTSSSGNSTRETKKSSIGTFFKQFSDSPKIPRTALLEWKRNARKRGKLPVCRFQKTIDQNKPDHFIFYTREEKAFEFNTRLTTTTSTSYGYKDKFLRISLEQLQDEAFSASPIAKLLTSKKRICEEEINLSEAIAMNAMERNLVLMEITQNGLSQIDSTIIAAKKLKKKTGIFPIKLGDDQDQEIVAYLVLRYTIICSTNDTQPSNLSTTMVSNDVTDDTEVSMTEQEVSDDEEDDEPFKSPRIINTPRSESKESIIVNTPPFGSPIAQHDYHKPSEDLVVSNNNSLVQQQPTINNEKTTESTITTTIEVAQQQEAIAEKVDTTTSQKVNSMESPPHKSSAATTSEEEGANFLLIEEEEEQEPVETIVVTTPQHATAEIPSSQDVKNTPTTVVEVIVEKEEVKPVEETPATVVVEQKPVETIATTSQHAEIPSSQVEKKEQSKKEPAVTFVEKEPEEAQSFLDLSEEEEEEQQSAPVTTNEPVIVHVNTPQPVNGQTVPEEELTVQTQSVQQAVVTPTANTQTGDSSHFESTNKKQTEDESDFDIIFSPNDESNVNSTTTTVESEPTPITTTTTNTATVLVSESEEDVHQPIEEPQPIIEDITTSNNNKEKTLTPEAQHDYSSDEDMFTPVYSSTNFPESKIPSVEEPPPVTKSLHTKIIEMVLNENKNDEESDTEPLLITSTDHDEVIKQNNELLTVLDLQKQKIIELENYSNSFHPLVVSLVWGLICSMLYSVSQVEVSAIRPILVATFYTIVVYFGVQLTRAMKFYNYGTHLTNYLKEMRFFKKLESIPKKDIGKLGYHLKKYISSEDFRFLDDLFRSASWGALFALVSLILKALFSSTDEQPNFGEEGIIYRFFVSGILYKCLYRSVTEELFERLFCLLLSLFIFNEFNLSIKIKYIIDKYTNPKHSEQYKTLSDFEKQQQKPTKSNKSTISLPHYSSVILATIISTIFSIGQPARHTFTTDSFIFDKLLGSFVYSYMFVVQEKVELCMVAHFTKNLIDVIFSYY